MPGVAEVASVGGFVRQYQITVDPNKLAAYGIPLMQVTEAVRKSNNEVGGRLIEWSGAEYMVRAHGYVKKQGDLEQIVVKARTGRRCGSRTLPTCSSVRSCGAASRSSTAKAKWRPAS